MKKSLLLLLFANTYLFSSAAAVVEKNLFLKIVDAVKNGDYNFSFYIDKDNGSWNQRMNDLLDDFVDNQNVLTNDSWKSLFDGIADSQKPKLFNTVKSAIFEGTKSQRASVLFVGLFTVYGVVAACLNVKKKLFTKENNS